MDHRRCQEIQNKDLEFLENKAHRRDECEAWSVGVLGSKTSLDSFEDFVFICFLEIVNVVLNTEIAEELCGERIKILQSADGQLFK